MNDTLMLILLAAGAYFAYTKGLFSGGATATTTTSGGGGTANTTGAPTTGISTTIAPTTTTQSTAQSIVSGVVTQPQPTTIDMAPSVPSSTTFVPVPASQATTIANPAASTQFQFPAYANSLGYDVFAYKYLKANYPTTLIQLQNESGAMPYQTMAGWSGWLSSHAPLTGMVPPRPYTMPSGGWVNIDDPTEFSYGDFWAAIDKVASGVSGLSGLGRLSGIYTRHPLAV